MMCILRVFEPNVLTLYKVKLFIADDCSWTFSHLFKLFQVYSNIHHSPIYSVKEIIYNFAPLLTQATYPKVEVADSPKIESSAQVTEQQQEEEEEEEQNDETGDDEPIYVARSTMTCEEDFILPVKEETPSSESDDYQSDEDFTEEKEPVEGETEQRTRDRNRNEHNPPKCRRTCTFEECIENLHRGRPVHYCSGDASACERNKCPMGLDGVSHHGSQEFRCVLEHWGEDEAPPPRGSKRNRGEKETKFPSNRR